MVSILKQLFKNNFFRDIFYLSYNIMIWNWKWKIILFFISSKYSYSKLIFNYTRKGLWNGTLICQNCDTLMWFCPFNIFEKKLQMKLLLCNVILNILIYISWNFEIDLMNKNIQKLFQNNCKHYFYNVKRLIPSYFWQMSIHAYLCFLEKNDYNP